jgi:hypothetical protein
MSSKARAPADLIAPSHGRRASGAQTQPGKST